MTQVARRDQACEIEQQFLRSLHRKDRDDEIAARSQSLDNFLFEQLSALRGIKLVPLTIAIGAFTDHMIDVGLRLWIGMKGLVHRPQIAGKENGDIFGSKL